MSGTPDLYVESDRFPSEAPPDELMPGEEFAIWLRAKVIEAGFEPDAPLGEDYGWGFWVTEESRHYWVSISAMGPTASGAQWVVSVTRMSSWNPLTWFRAVDPSFQQRLHHTVETALEADPNIHRLPEPGV